MQSGSNVGVPRGLGFPIALAHFGTRHPRSVVAAFVLVAAVAAVFSSRLRDADDLLDFIPPDDPDVRVFREVNNTFGALRVALVGIEAKKGDDVFAPETVKRLAAATEAVRGVHGVDRVVSLTSLPDFVPSDAGVEVLQLIPGPPATDAERKALVDKVMSRPHVVGNFITRDRSAALMLVFLAVGSHERTVAHEIRKAVEDTIGDLHAVYGGAPFAAASIYDETQADIRRLTPLAVFLILGVILLSFRDPVGVVLTIVCVAWSTLLIVGGMGLLGEPFTVASATLPVILFASGSSYAVHLLGRYYALGGSKGAADGGGWKPGELAGESRIVTATRIVGPPVAIAGFTTSAGFFSFLVMDIRPMRAFGLECAFGVLLCLLASLLLVPAVITLWPRGGARPAETGQIGAGLAWVARFAKRRRVPVVIAALALAAATIGPMRRVEVRMEPRAFFRPGSGPWLAEQFLSDKFGGSQFLMVNLRGDFAEPAALHEMKRLEQFARALPGVTQVNSIVEPLTLVNDAMGGGNRLPETRTQVQNLLFFVEGEASVRNVLNPARDQVLVHIRIQGDMVAVLAAMENYLAHTFNPSPIGATREQAAERLRWVATAAGSTLSDDTAQLVVKSLRMPAPDDARVISARRAIATALVTGEGEVLPKRALTDAMPTAAGPDSNFNSNPSHPDATARPPITLAQIVDELARDPGDTGHAWFLQLAPSPEEAALAWKAFTSRLFAAERALAVEDATRPLGAIPASALLAMKDTLGDLLPEKPCAPLARPLVTALAGEPILDRGMSRSVARNQEHSLIVAIIAVLLLMGLLFRSVWLAVISVFPAALAMATVFGGMAILGVRLDIGTSLVASIATGAGSDFAMHYLWYLKRSSPDEVLRFVGPIMVISVVLIAAGFAVLGAGNSQPMRMFGALAAIAMSGAALFTFFLVPALLRPSDSAPSSEDKAA